MRLDYIRSFINVVNCKSFSVAAKKGICLTADDQHSHQATGSGIGSPAFGQINKRCDIVRRRRFVLSICSQASGDGNEALAHLNKTEAK